MKRFTNRITQIFIVGIVLAEFANVFAYPPTVELSQVVLTAKHRETITFPGATSKKRLVTIRSSNPSVATAQDE